MMLAIFIFLLIIVVLDLNVYIYVKSVNDNLKVYFSVGGYYHLIPYKKIFSKEKLNNKDIKKGNSLALSILSHSVIDHIYIAKFSVNDLTLNPIGNSLYLIIANQIRGLLQSRCKYINNNKLRLEYDLSYENIDYYFEAHSSIICIMWALIISKFKR